jgi:hypothetical protein
MRLGFVGFSFPSEPQLFHHGRSRSPYLPLLIPQPVRILLPVIYCSDKQQLEVCGILGLLLHDPGIDAAPEIAEGLSLLQHRGQDACGMITCGPKGRFYQCKANGMVRDVFDSSAIARLIGGMGVGHGALVGADQVLCQNEDIYIKSYSPIPYSR